MEDDGKLPDICDLFNKYDSIKDRDGYLQAYHVLFHKIRANVITVLEIGASSSIAGSLLALRDYFVSARIIGIDTDPVNMTDEPRVETYLCNPTRKEDVDMLLSKLGGIKFDIIIDNGSYVDMEQISILRNLYPHINENGTYIIEGISPESKLVKCPSLIGCVCNHDPYFFVGIKNNMCIIYKNHLNSKRRLY